MNWDSTYPLAKETYLAELARRLAGLPEEELAEAMTYYEEYFDDAGPDQVERVLNELGPAEKLAQQILSGYGWNYQDSAPQSSSDQVPARPEDAARARAEEEAAQKAEAERRRQAEQQAQAEARAQEQARQRAHKQENNNTVLIILIAILSFPIWFPVLAALFGLILAVFAAAGALVIAAVAVTIALFISGIILFVAGFPLLFVTFWDGMAALGGGLILIGIAALCLLAGGAICFKLFPALIRLVIRIVQWPFNRKRRATA